MTADNAAELVNNLTSVLGDSIEQVQTTENLNIVANVLEDVVGLLNEGNFTVDESVREHYAASIYLFLPYRMLSQHRLVQ